MLLCSLTKHFALPWYTWQILAKIWVLKNVVSEAQFSRGVQNVYRRMQNWWWKWYELVGKTILNAKALKYNNVLVLPFLCTLKYNRIHSSLCGLICMSNDDGKKNKHWCCVWERIYGNIYNTSGFHHTTGEPSHGLIWSLICCLVETMRIWWASNTHAATSDFSNRNNINFKHYCMYLIKRLK